MTAGPVQSDFKRGFRELAGRVHRRRRLREVLTATGFGLALGALGALGLWALRLGELCPLAAGLGLLGAGAGAYLAQRGRWSDREVALYLDARLGSHETLTTALEAGESEADLALAHVVERASAVLMNADHALIRPRLWSLKHALLPLAAAAIVGISIAPRPKAPPSPAAPPGAALVQLEHLKGLEMIEDLSHLSGRTPEQSARLKALAEQAKKLRLNLAKGLERREALSEIAKLRDGISAERLKLGDQQNRAGLDAALDAFNKNPLLNRAQRALGNGDLTAFDDEMQQLANRAERSDRETAKDALERAAKEARAKGAQGLADTLESERRLFDRREARAQTLREFARGLKNKLSPEALDDLKEFGRSGAPKAGQRLADALDKALQGLTPEERARLQEKLQQQLDDAAGGGTPMSEKQLRELQKQLASDAGVEALRQQLQELAKPQPSEDSKRERGLREADRGGAEAERGLGAVPIPMDGAGDQASNPRPSPGANDAGKQGGEGPGSNRDAGASDHAGATPEVSGHELRAKADVRVQGGAPLRGATLGHAPARAGETANELGTGSLGQARQTEVGAVDRSDIPEEYREQVGRYFEP